MPETNIRPKSRTSLSKRDFVRQDIDAKRSRAYMTPTGMKIIRLQPTMNYDSLHKYQSRAGTVSSSQSTSPRYSSSPTKVKAPSPAGLPQQRPPSTTGRTNERTSSALSMRSTGTQTSLEQAASTGVVREKPPSPARPASSRSNHSSTYNARSNSCRPSHMYMNEDLRRSAKLNRPPSHVYSCEEDRDYELSTKTPRSPRRFDGTVVNLPNFMKANEFLTHDDLTMGQKQYIWGIARIYSVSHLMQLKQRQYQSLLDYEFNRRMQSKEMKERERVREWKEYHRYTRFIKKYDQRIPRAAKQPGSSPSPCEEVSHIHRHVIKGWTTNPQSNEAYRPVSRGVSRGEQRREEEEEVRGLPDYHSEEDETSDTLTGQYRVTVVKTSNESGDKESDTGRPKSPAGTRREDEIEEDKDADSGRNSVIGEHFSDGEDNYL